MARQYTKDEIDLLRTMNDPSTFALDQDTGLYNPVTPDQEKAEADQFEADHPASAQPSLMQNLIQNPKNLAFNPTAVESKGDIAFPAAGPFKPEATPNIVQALLNTYHSNPQPDAAQTGTAAGGIAGVGEPSDSETPDVAAGKTGAEAGANASNAPEAPAPQQDLTSRALATLQNYRNAQQVGSDAEARGNLGKSLNLINAGLSRVEPTAAQNQIFNDVTAAGKGVESNYLKQVEFQKQDPNSPISKVYNDFMEKLGVKLPEGQKYSAADLEKLSPLVFKKHELELAQQAKLEAATEKRESIERENEKNRDLKREIASAANEAKKTAAETKKEADLEKKQTKANQESLQFLETSRQTPDVRQALTDKYNIQKAKSILKGKNLNDISNQEVGLFVSELSKIARGGVPTQDELKAISPNTLTGQLSKVYSRLINEPTPENAGGFLKEYKKYLGDLEKNANDTISKKVHRVIESKKKDLGDENYNNLKNLYGDMLNPEGDSDQKEDPKVRKYADEHFGGDYDKALQLLQTRGYGR